MNNKESAQKVLDLMALIEKDLYKFISGISIAGRRARVNLVKLEKAGKEFRKKSTKD